MWQQGAGHRPPWGNPGWNPPPHGGHDHYHPGAHVSWVSSGSGNVPPGAVWAGKDSDGGDIYVGRASHEGDMLPAKVAPSHGGAFVSWGGEEHSKFSYEVLCCSNVAWERSSHGHVPYGAIEAGRTSSGEPLFIGRVLHNGTLTPGKIHPSHRMCYIPFGGQELPFDSYEVLVSK